MSWYWQTYVNIKKNEYWSLIYDDGSFEDEMAYIEKKNGQFVACAMPKTRSFKNLTDAKRFCEDECGIRLTKKKKKVPAPFGL